MKNKRWIALITALCLVLGCSGISSLVSADNDPTPEDLGYTRYTLKDLGIADNTYSTNAVTAKQVANGLNNMYLDVDVAFSYKADGTADPYTGIKVGHKSASSWDGIRIGIDTGDKLTVRCAQTNKELFAITTEQAGVDTFTKSFNLKFATQITQSSVAGCMDITISLWINNKLIKQDVKNEAIPGIGDFVGILSWNGAGVTVATADAASPEPPAPEGDTPEELGFTRFTLSELGIADGTYNTNAVTTRDAGGLNGKYLDVDVSFGYKPDGTADASTGIKIGNTAATSWDGIKIGLIAGDKLTVNFTTTNYTAFTLTAAEAGVDTFTETFNLKFATKMEPNAGKTDVTIHMWINDKLVKKDVLVGGMSGIGNYAGILTWNGAGVTVATPEQRVPEETEPDVTEPQGDTPEAMGFTRFTLSELGIADGTYSSNAVTTRDTGGLNGKYLDVDVSFGYKPDGTADASTGIKIGNTAATSWDGIKIGLIAGDKLTVNFTTTNYTAFTLTAAEAGVDTFTETFNLKLATKMEPNAGKTDVTIHMWINDKLVKKDVLVGGMSGIGNYAGILTWNGASVTVATPEVSTPDEPVTGNDTPEELGYTMVTLKNQFAVADGTYNTNAVVTSPYPKGLNNTCLNVDASFGYKPDGTADASSGIKYANTAPTSWDGFKIGLLEGDRLTVNYTATNFEIFTLTAQQAGVETFTETFNLKFAVKIAENNGKSDVTITMWINDNLIKKDVFVGGLSAIGNCAGILTWNGASVTVSTPEGSDTGVEKDDRVPDYENPPTQMGGKTWAGNYITSVDLQNSTTVISAADTDNGYKTSADYTAYGLDYVMDLNVDRELKILQITDTQIIDAAQCRSDDRLLDFQKSNWATDKMYNNVLRYIVKAVNDTKPDLILLTGDIIYGEFDDNGSAMMALINCMDSLQIPWAPVFGNHENESEMGVAWQCKQLENSPYCLFTRRNEIGGNGNYSIGIAKNGQLQRVIFMMDSNGCARSSNVNGTAVKSTVGFTPAQRQWLRNTGLQINAAAGKTVPSFLGYHIPTDEPLLGAIAAGYQSGEDSADIIYTIGVDNVAQPGDSGYKGDAFNGYGDAELLPILKEIGTDGVYLGHVHLISTSVMYEGIRWTFGLKTGTYDESPEILGGTLITVKADNSFTVAQTQTTAKEIAEEYPNRIYTPPVVEDLPSQGDLEVLPEDFTQISFHSFDIDNGTYGMAVGLTVEGKNPDSLDRTLFSGDVVFNNVGGFLTYAGGASAWHGMRFEPQSNGTLVVSEAELRFPQFTITPELAGTTLVGEKFNLKITTEFIEADFDGLKNDVKFGIWINDVLYKNQYVYAANYTDTIGGYMGIYCPAEDSSMTVDAGEVDYGEPIQPDPSLKVISFSSFGVADGSYGYNENGLAVSGNFYNPAKGRSLDGTLLTGNIRLDDGTDIRFGGKDNPWLGIYLMAVGDAIHLYANDALVYKFMPNAAGTTLVGEAFDLKMSINYVDSDGDGAADDVKLGLWFNGALYKNKFLELQDVAPTLGSMMSIYSPYEGRYVQIISTEVDNNADLSIFGFDKNYEKYLDRTGKPRTVRTEL